MLDLIDVNCYTCLMGLIVFVVVLNIHFKLTRVRFNGNETLVGKTAVVTGSNSGIGLETAKDFARRGARVVMVCRDMIKAERAKSEIIVATNNTNISLKHLDFFKLDSVRKCANEILAEEKRIDILVNNAGAGGMGFGQTVDGLEKLMQSNYYGPFLFTNILLGKIKESAPSRIVNVSSTVHSLGKIDFNHKTQRTLQFFLYCDTKLANILFSNELARKLIGKGVTSNSLHPGVFRSNVALNLHSIPTKIAGIFMDIFFQSTETAAQTSVYLSVSPDVANVTGKYFSNCKSKTPSNTAQDMELAKKLWDFTEDAVKLKTNEKHY